VFICTPECERIFVTTVTAPDLSPRLSDADEHTRAVAERFALLAANGALELPYPGGGETRRRWQALTALAEQDLALARLAEGHVDALAIVHEIDTSGTQVEVRKGQRWGVWAAEPPGTGLRAVPASEGGWRLSGTKAYCSGARSCAHALVTARAGEERRLFVLDLRAEGTRPIPDSWSGPGMTASDTLDIEFDQAPATALGAPRAYLDRPGFQHGGIGVAACWYGGARAVVRTLHQAAGRYDVGPHALAQLGAAYAKLDAVRTQLDGAAADIDADPLDLQERAAVRSKRVRAFTEAVCGDVLVRVGRALGAAPLAHDANHARMATDLTVYIRQHHGERDAAALGEAVKSLDWSEL
jgi:alkylation response protein AidB-like acyl-CoA dehydrogenase